jgi:hypothetical protein
MTYDVSLHSTGTYRFLPAIDPYSSGVAAEPGYDIVGLRFDRPPSVPDGFARLDRELERRGLPADALVGLELRSPEPFSFGGFDEFNEVYRALLTERGLLEGKVNPIARTNVVPVHAPPAEPVLLSAFIVQKAQGPGGSDFVVAGSGEVDGPLDPRNIVARGDVSEEGLGRKIAFVLDEMRARLAGLGHTPQDPTLVNVYTAYEAAGLSAALVDRLPATGRSGFVRWLTLPPVAEIDFEMDCRRVSGWQAL